MKLATSLQVSPFVQKLSIATAMTVLISLTASPLVFSQDLESSEGKAGYSIGVNIGMNLVNQGITADIDEAALIAGISDAFSDNLQLTEEQMMAAIQEFSALQQVRAQEAVQEQAQAGVEFLATNGQRDGVTTTASGLQYEVMRDSFDANAPMPSVSDTVNVHYHGTLTDGSVFDSSVDRGEPISFPLNGVIAGWTEGLQLMRTGDKFRFFIPSDLAYGATGAGSIGPNATLIFEVELLEIQ